MPIQKITSGIIQDGAVAAADIVSVSNTAISGLITASQIAAVNGSVITANTIANSAIQTGAVENYMSAAGLGFGMRNRIINGAMVISQRNAGASVTVNDNPAVGLYPTDRFLVQGTTSAGVYTAQQSTSTPPSGFTNFLRMTTTTASASPAAGAVYVMSQIIEGYNIADFGFGAAGASTITVSFWVRSSLTGTFSGSLRNGTSFNRSYPFTYAISAANTWEQKSVTIAGDTSGTWSTGNTGGLVLAWDIGGGSTYASTANTWQAGNYTAVTGSTRLISTLSATLDITGVQLEKGSTATSFDYRPYGTELALCQRYYQKVTNAYLGLTFNAASLNYGGYPLKVTMRAAPTLDSGASYSVASGSAGTPAFQNAGSYNSTTADVIQLYNSASNWTTSSHCSVSAGFSSEL
jgi:hypothetical protein